MEIVRQLGKFVQKISVGLRASDCRFVGDVLLGVVQRGSTMLTEIGVAFLPLGTSSVPQPIFGSNGVRIRPSPPQ